MMFSNTTLNMNNLTFQRIVIVFLVTFSLNSYSQFVSKSNSFNYWSNNSSWESDTAPGTTISSSDIYCNGELIALCCLEIDQGTLFVNDTLIVNGNLALKNQGRLEIDTGGVLIIYGDYTSNNNVEVINEGIFIVTGGFSMLGSDSQGYFNNNSRRLYIFDPTPEIKGGSLYELISCSDTSDYPSSCGYGNKNDLFTDPVYQYFSALSYSKRNVNPEGDNLCSFIDFVVDTNNSCINNTLKFELISSGLSASDSIVWIFGPDAQPDTIYGLGPAEVRYTNKGLKDVKLIVVNDTVITKPEIVNIVECRKPDFTSNSNYACAGDTILFSNLSTGITEDDYLIWDFGPGSKPLNLSGAGPYKVVYKTIGYKDVSLTILNDTFTIKPEYVFISECKPLDYLQSKEKACVGDTIEYTNTSFDAESVDTIMWNFGNDAVPKQAYGKGPHKVVYELPGEKDIELSTKKALVASQIFGNTTAIEELPQTGIIYSDEIEATTYTIESCVNKTVLYRVKVHEKATYLWTIPGLDFSHYGSAEVSIDWDTEPGDYLLFVQEISDIGCRGSVSDVLVSLKNCKEEIFTEALNYIFTPNNDGINDTWQIEGIENFPLAKIYVFDRVGNLVFKCDEHYLNNWDGKHRDRTLPPDSYYYLIDLSTYNKESIRGIVTLIH